MAACQHGDRRATRRRSWRPTVAAHVPCDDRGGDGGSGRVLVIGAGGRLRRRSPTGGRLGRCQCYDIAGGEGADRRSWRAARSVEVEAGGARKGGYASDDRRVSTSGSGAVAGVLASRTVVITTAAGPQESAHSDHQRDGGGMAPDP